MRRLAFALLMAVAGTAGAQLAATVGDTAIGATELEDAAQGRLLKLRSDEYTVRQEVLDELIARTLIEREAKARGITAEELYRAEVDAKVPPLTEAEIRAGWEMSESETRTLDQTATALRQKRLDERREAFVKSLREKAGVRVLLDPPRMHIDEGGATSKGPADAPVTIVEFSEFQCPYCGRATATLKQLEARYGDRVRIVFRHFPLASHADAPKASEAALCAGEQQRFWEMHDRLFAGQNRLKADDLVQHAAAIGIDSERFRRCLDSGRFAERVQADLAEGTRYGVTGTPAFFINGRPLVGAMPYESFARLIDDELARTTATDRRASGTPSP